MECGAMSFGRILQIWCNEVDGVLGHLGVGTHEEAQGTSALSVHEDGLMVSVLA
jgi:hypothetical protein